MTISSSIIKHFVICLSWIAMISCSNPRANIAKNNETISARDSLVTNPEEPNPKDVMNDLVKSYSENVMIDTLFKSKNDSYEVKFAYFCTMDSALKIPARYNHDTHTDFVSHDFKSVLILVRNQDTIFNTVIDKKTFEKFLFPQLDSFATLMFPYFKISNDTIDISYSISIPATDVGIGARIKFDKDGNSFVSDK